MNRINTEADAENFTKLLEQLAPIQRFSDPKIDAEGYNNLSVFVEKLDLVINVKLVINKESNHVPRKAFPSPQRVD